MNKKGIVNILLTIVLLAIVVIRLTRDVVFDHSGDKEDLVAIKIACSPAKKLGT